MTVRYGPPIDELLALLPVPPDGEVVDDLRQPTTVLPDRLYAWPLRLGPHQLDGDGEDQGRWDEAAVRVRVLYTLGSRGEARVGSGDRAVSDALDDAQAAIHAAVSQHRRGVQWWDAYATNVLPDAVRSERARGVAVDVTLRLVVPQPDVAGS